MGTGDGFIRMGTGDGFIYVRFFLKIFVYMVISIKNRI